MNRKRKSAHRRTISVLLTICMLIACLPLNALSAGEPPAAGSAALPPAETSNIEESSEVCIVEEDLSKRGEYEKHFLCSDGTYIAVTYAEPVHYLDADGTWADTDVALSLNTASSRYEAQSGGFAVSFASAYSASAQQPAAVSMTDGAFPVSWTTAVAGTLLPAAGRSGLQASASCDALVPYTPSVSVLTAQQSQAASLQSFAGRPVADADSFAAPDRISVAQYTGIAQTAGQSAGVSLRYSVSQHRIKEDIIIADKSAVTDFVTTLDIGALTAAPQDDGSVLLTDGNGDTVYTVGVPYLYDAEYNVSYGVEVTVSQTGSVCRITYSPDREWMFSDERVYPVVLDPTITSGEYAANIVDTYVTQADSNNHSGEPNITVGIKNGKIYRAYIKINSLPTLPYDTSVSSGRLIINHGANTTTGKRTNLYRVEESWNPNTITYSNKPSEYSFPISYCSFNTSNVNFNISSTHILRMYNIENHGFMIRYEDESTTNPDYNVLRSMEYPTASQRPVFSVSYYYSLPSSLTYYNVDYKIRNEGSGKYLDIYGGQTTAGANIIQKTSSNSASQKFNITSGMQLGGVRLASAIGTGFVTLSCESAELYPENGSNVRITKSGEGYPLQEMLIIPVGQAECKIVSAANPMLALTAVGTADGGSGTSSNSAGNVYYSSYTGSESQKWTFWHDAWDSGEWTRLNLSGTNISNGEYYLINRDTNEYLHKSGTSLQADNVVIDDTYTSYRWLITELPNENYTIKSSSDPNYSILGSTASGITLSNLTDGQWNAEIANRGGVIYTFEAPGETYALVIDNGEVVHRPYISDPSDENYDRQVWMTIRYDSYVSLTDFTVSVSDVEMLLGDSVSFTIEAEPENANYQAPGNYTYQILEGEQVISLDNMYISALEPGTARIKITHNISGISKYIDVTVKEWFDPPPNDPSSNLYAKSGRYFSIPFEELIHYTQEEQFEEMLENRNMDGYEFIEEDFFRNPPYGVDDILVRSYDNYGMTVYTRSFVELLRRSRISVISTHGSSTSLALSSTDPQVEITTSMLYDLPDNYFQYCQLILLMTCSSGEISYLDNNLIIALYSLGANAVVGFDTEVDVEFGAQFEYNFMNYLKTSNGKIWKNYENPYDLESIPDKNRGIQEAAISAIRAIDNGESGYEDNLVVKMPSDKEDQMLN